MQGSIMNTYSLLIIVGFYECPPHFTFRLSRFLLRLKEQLPVGLRICISSFYKFGNKS